MTSETITAQTSTRHHETQVLQFLAFSQATLIISILIFRQQPYLIEVITESAEPISSHEAQSSTRDTQGETMNN